MHTHAHTYIPTHMHLLAEFPLPVAQTHKHKHKHTHTHTHSLPPSLLDCTWIDRTDGLVVCHLPYGPTAYFSLSNVVMRHDIPDAGTMSEAFPHLIFHQFQSSLGQRVCIFFVVGLFVCLFLCVFVWLHSHMCMLGLAGVCACMLCFLACVYLFCAVSFALFICEGDAFTNKRPLISIIWLIAAPNAPFFPSLWYAHSHTHTHTHTHTRTHTLTLTHLQSPLPFSCAYYLSLVYVHSPTTQVKSILKYLFPVPKEDSKRVVTFANNEDFISFRWGLNVLSIILCKNIHEKKG